MGVKKRGRVLQGGQCGALTLPLARFWLEQASTKMKTTVFALIFLAVVITANASIEFVGYITSGENITFALIDTTDGRAKFLELGANFAGYRVAEYVKETETLTLRREGETLAVKLRSATFTIPVEVTGEEREKQFFAKLKEMSQKAGEITKKINVEDYMATATQFGREIVSYDVKDGVETIVMARPNDERPSLDKDGRMMVHGVRFVAHRLSRDKKTKVTLIIQ
jgi:hypothetical protein